MARETKEIKLGDKEYKINEVDPITAQEFKLIEIAGKEFRIDKLDVYETRHILFRYPLTALSKDEEDYEKNEKLFDMLMSHVEVRLPTGDWLKLEYRELVRQHVPPMGFKILEREVIDLTTNFFTDGVFQDLTATLLELTAQKFIEMLTQLLPQSSQVEKQA